VCTVPELLAAWVEIPGEWPIITDVRIIFSIHALRLTSRTVKTDCVEVKSRRGQLHTLKPVKPIFTV